MSITVHIQDGPLPDSPSAWPHLAGSGESGAVVCFEGVVRAREDGALINALEYEVYGPMAARELHRLAGEVLNAFGLHAVWVEHSRGRVPVGQCSFRLRMAAAGRTEALRAMEVFIDRLKQDVPIWKTPVFAAPAADEARAADAGV